MEGHLLEAGFKKGALLGIRGLVKKKVPRFRYDVNCKVGGGGVILLRKTNEGPIS